LENKVREHYELISELISLQQESSRRLRIMENVQAIIIPVYAILGLSGLAALLKIFGVVWQK